MNKGSINDMISQGKLKEAAEEYRILMEATMSPVTRQFARSRVRKAYKEMKKNGEIVL